MGASVRGVSRIGGELRPSESTAKPDVLCVATNRDHHVAVGHRERLVRHDVRVRVTDPVRRLPRHEVIQRLIGEHSDHGVKQCHVDMLPQAGALAGRKCSLDADDTVRTG